MAVAQSVLEADPASLLTGCFAVCCQGSRPGLQSRESSLLLPSGPDEILFFGWGVWFTPKGHQGHS